MRWQPIETAPKDAHSSRDGSQYGPYILAYPINGGVARVRWWQSAVSVRCRNFLGDCGNAYHPTHWMPLPDPPTPTEDAG